MSIEQLVEEHPCMQQNFCEKGMRGVGGWLAVWGFGAGRGWLAGGLRARINYGGISYAATPLAMLSNLELNDERTVSATECQLTCSYLETRKGS